MKSVAYDRWNSSQTIIDLTNEGLTFTPFGQGFGSMSTPTKEFQRMVLTKELEHFDNPVLRWMLSNAVVVRDPADNIKIDKKKSTQKVDGIVASIMAHGEYMTAAADEKGGDPYAERGLLD